MTVQSQLVNDGSYAAEAVASGAPAYAYEQLSQTWPSLYYATRFYVKSHTSGSAYLLRLRTDKKAAITAVYRQLHRQARVAQRCHVHQHDQFDGRSPPAPGTPWSSTATHGSGQVSVWLDGTQVGALTGPQSLGTHPHRLPPARRHLS